MVKFRTLIKQVYYFSTLTIKHVRQQRFYKELFFNKCFSKPDMIRKRHLLGDANGELMTLRTVNSAISQLELCPLLWSFKTARLLSINIIYKTKYYASAGDTSRIHVLGGSFIFLVLFLLLILSSEEYAVHDQKIKLSFHINSDLRQNLT